MVRVSTPDREDNEVTQQAAALHHTGLAYGFRRAENRPLSATSAALAAILAKGATNAGPSGYQPPANKARSLANAGTGAEAHGIAKQSATGTGLDLGIGARFKAGGEGVRL